MPRCVYVAVELWSMLRLWDSIALTIFIRPSVNAELTQPISQAGQCTTYAVGSLFRLFGSIAWLSIGCCMLVSPSGEWRKLRGMQQITQGSHSSRALLAGSGLPRTQSQSLTTQRSKGSLQVGVLDWHLRALALSDLVLRRCYLGHSLRHTEKASSKYSGLHSCETTSCQCLLKGHAARTTVNGMDWPSVELTFIRAGR